MGRKDNKGALLLEALLGMSIFVTALLLAFGVFPSSQKATAHSRNYNVASAMAREIVETEVAKPYADIVDEPADPNLYNPAERFFRSNTKETASRIRLPFEWRIDEEPIVTVPPVNGKSVIATVRWEDGPFLREVSYESWVVEN